MKHHNPKQLNITDSPYKILIIGGSGSRKTSSVFNLINRQTVTDEIFLYDKDPYEAKCQFSINK